MSVSEAAAPKPSPVLRFDHPSRGAGSSRSEPGSRREAAPGDLGVTARPAWDRMRSAAAGEGRSGGLERLRERGILSEAEFTAEKARLLS